MFQKQWASVDVDMVMIQKPWALWHQAYIPEVSFPHWKNQVSWRHEWLSSEDWKHCDKSQHLVIPDGKKGIRDDYNSVQRQMGKSRNQT